jgi:hypothetical protein
MLAQTRPGAKGALLFSAAFPVSEFGGSWPSEVPLQIHMDGGRRVGDGGPPRRARAR